MAREITAAELAQMLPEDAARHLRNKAQRELDKINVHDVALESVVVNLAGTVLIRGRGTATPQEIDSISRRTPVLQRMIAASKRKGGGHA